eukprot:m.209424 g.209424  ORF g.209424 m.209424 type:complete len:108 (-) comp25460_c0_seq1:1177-1500(-)
MHLRAHRITLYNTSPTTHRIWEKAMMPQWWRVLLRVPLGTLLYPVLFAPCFGGHSCVKQSDALMPPNPKELHSAASSLRSRIDCPTTISTPSTCSTAVVFMVAGTAP